MGWDEAQPEADLKALYSYFKYIFDIPTLEMKRQVKN